VNGNPYRRKRHHQHADTHHLLGDDYQRNHGVGKRVQNRRIKPSPNLYGEGQIPLFFFSGQSSGGYQF